MKRGYEIHNSKDQRIGQLIIDRGRDDKAALLYIDVVPIDRLYTIDT